MILKMLYIIEYLIFLILAKKILYKFAWGDSLSKRLGQKSSKKIGDAPFSKLIGIVHRPIFVLL
ncbi:hypothetical protein RyT2_06460 [Pseudolactococcus yaeyamensis]